MRVVEAAAKVAATLVKALGVKMAEAAASPTIHSKMIAVMTAQVISTAARVMMTAAQVMMTAASVRRRCEECSS